MSGDKFLPCPFCGFSNAAVMEKPGHSRLWVECLTCGASGPDVEDWNVAVSTWNSRAKWTVKEKERGDE